MQPRHREAESGDTDRRAAAHELRTQLQALVALVENAPRRDAWTRRLRRCADTLLDIAEDWLGARGGETAFAPGPAVRSVVADLAPCAQAKAIRLTCAVGKGCPSRVVGDRRAFRTLLANLVGNAVKFTRSGSVKVRLSGGRIGVLARMRVEVTDTGPGLGLAGDADLERLAASSRRRGGTGLGLALAREAARRLGGSLTGGDAEGGGARLVAELALPLVGSGRMACARPEKPAAGLRVLVADDHGLNRELARRHLCRRGHAVTCAADARAALRLARCRRFDVALVDLRLPDMAGADLARRLGEADPALRILAWSADDAEGDLAPFAGRLAKPCPGAEIARAAEAAARAEHAEDDCGLARRILLRRSRQECARLDRAMRSGKPRRIAEEAHRAQGALAMAGLAALAALARQAGREAREGRARAAGRMLGKVIDGLRRLGTGLTSG